jgi:hypothetical protein
MSESRACEHSITAALLHRCLIHTILRFNYLVRCSPLKVIRSGRNSIRSTKLFSKTLFQTMADLTPSVLDIFHCVRNIYFTLCFGSQICFHVRMADCHYNYMFLYFVFHITVVVGICHRTLRILLFYAIPTQFGCRSNYALPIPCISAVHLLFKICDISVGTATRLQAGRSVFQC